jgi:hypothetical protein
MNPFCKNRHSQKHINVEGRNSETAAKLKKYIKNIILLQIILPAATLSIVLELWITLYNYYW